MTGGHSTEYDLAGFAPGDTPPRPAARPLPSTDPRISPTHAPGKRSPDSQPETCSRLP
jgi:hypothetical protein